MYGECFTKNLNTHSRFDYNSWTEIFNVLSYLTRSRDDLPQGFEERDVTCVSSVSGVVVDETHCVVHKEKPESRRSCESHRSCKPVATWRTGQWGEVSTFSLYPAKNIFIFFYGVHLFLVPFFRLLAVRQRFVPGPDISIRLENFHFFWKLMKMSRYPLRVSSRDLGVNPTNLFSVFHLDLERLKTITCFFPSLQPYTRFNTCLL